MVLSIVIEHRGGMETEAGAWCGCDTMLTLGDLAQGDDLVLFCLAVFGTLQHGGLTKLWKAAL
jgi:hypothetical protein